MAALFFDRMTIIVSMVAQMAAIAMTGFIKRIDDIPPPMCPTCAVRAIRPSQGYPLAGTTAL
jgi:hypothetical protein